MLTQASEGRPRLFNTPARAKSCRCPMFSKEAAHLRKLARKCRRIAATKSDEIELASLRQMAADYGTLADKIDHPAIPNLLPPLQ